MHGIVFKMCALARGIMLGIAKHYRETIAIKEPTCSLSSAKACRLEVSLVAGSVVRPA